MKHYSPSFMGSLALCARCTQDDDGPKNEAAENGTLFHGDMEQMIKTLKPAKYEGFINGLKRSDDHKDMMRAALQEVSAYLCLGLPVVGGAKFRYSDGIKTIAPGVYVEASVELWPDDRRHKVGRIDMLVVPAEKNAIIVDWKTNRADSDFSWQLDSYAGALKRLCSEPWVRVTGKIVSPNLEQHDDIIYDPAAIELAEKRILAVEERANNPFTSPCPGEHQCKYCRCKRLGQCPAIAASVSSGIPNGSGIPSEVIVKNKTDIEAYNNAVAVAINRPSVVLKPTTLEQRADRRDWMSVASMLVDYIKEDDKAYFQNEMHSGEQLPGYTVSTRAGNRMIDRSKLKDVNRKLMTVFGIDADSMLEFLEPKKDLLVEKLALSLGSEKAAEEKYSEVVDEFTLRGAPITTLRRDSARKLIKLQVTE